MQHTNLDIPEDQLKEWYEDRILSRDSYDPDSTELEDKEREWRPLWDALLQLRGRNLKCVIAGEMLCNPCVVLIVGWGSVKGTEDKMGTIIGLFSGVVYT